MEKKKTLQIPMGKKLYNKKYCVKLAKKIRRKKQISGMSIRELAHEIYAHAYVFYNFRLVPEFLRNVRPFKSIYKSVSDGVDLEDNGDTLIRRIAYRLIWEFPAFVKASGR